MKGNSDEIDEQMGACIALMLNMDRLYGEYARKKGLTYMSLLLLETIYGAERCTQKRISEETNYPKQTVNMIIRSFQEKGWVDLVTLPEDRRNKAVVLTDEGRSFATDVIEPFRRCVRDSFERIGREDRERIARSLTEFNESFSAKARDLLDSDG